MCLFVLFRIDYVNLYRCFPGLLYWQWDNRMLRPLPDTSWNDQYQTRETRSNSSSNFISRRIQYDTFHTHNISTISQMYSSGGCQRCSAAHWADNRYFNNDTAVGKQGATAYALQQQLAYFWYVQPNRIASTRIDSFRYHEGVAVIEIVYGLHATWMALYFTTSHFVSAF